MQRKTIGLSDELYDYVVATTHADDDILARLRDETSTMEQSGMQIAPEQGQFMALMARLIGARRVIEVGVFTGYSSLCVARALGEEGHLVACDVNEDWTAIARRYWEAAEVDQRIDLRLAPATDTLEGLIADGQAATFDMASSTPTKSTMTPTTSDVWSWSARAVWSWSTMCCGVVQ